MKDLYPHNQSAYDAIMRHYGEGNRKAAIVHATGTGKSYIIAAVAEHYGKVLIIAPNNFVLNETRKVCHEGCEFRTYASVMYDEGDAGKYDLIVLDEFHRSGAEKWGAGAKRLIDSNPQALLLGTSATHIRYLDNNRNMADEMFDGQIVSYLPLKDAIDQDILPNPTYVSSIYSMDETIRSRKRKVRSSRMKESVKKDICRRLDGIAHRWDDAGGVPAIIRKYYHKDMQRVIVFCSKVRRAAAARQILGKWFGLAGYSHVRYYNIDYKEKRLEKEMEDFQKPLGDYDLKVAISVNMLNEGVHVPHVDGVIMLRTTVSRIIIEQQVGRCLTSDNNGQKPVVLDLVNNMDLVKYDESINFEGWNKNRTDDDSESRNGSGFPFTVIDECRDMRILLTQLDNEIRKPVGYWTLDRCKCDALNYRTRMEWKTNQYGAYQAACENNWLEECCAHMIEIRKPDGYWTLDRCKSIALNYNTRTEWEKSDPASINYARHHGWMDECCAHMKRINKIYTFESLVEIAKKYKTQGEWSNSDPNSMRVAARRNLVERICQAAGLKRKQKHTLESCKKIAMRFKTRIEWQEKEPLSYKTASNNKWMDECCAHMTLLKTHHTKEECFKSAQKYMRRSDWLRGSRTLYSYAANHGWLDECCAHMLPKNVRQKTIEY